MEGINQGKRKKALLLMGSPRPEGATAKMLGCFMEQWQPQGEITLIEAYRAKINPCIHCGYCKHSQGCRYEDDFRVIDQGLREADLLVIGSPVYGLGFPAPLKAIFDRTQQYFEAKFSLGIQKPIPKYKPALLLTAFGSPDPRGVQLLQEQIRLPLLLMNAGLKQTLRAPHTDRFPVNLPAIQDEIKQVLQGLET